MATTKRQCSDEQLLQATRILRPSNAIELVRSCREARIRILGLDAVAVHVDRGCNQSIIESFDLSVPPCLTEFGWKLAEDFIDERLDSGLYFDVILDD